MDERLTVSVRKILIICLNGMGDVITTTPLVLSVRNAYPDAKILMLVKNKFMENVFGNSNIVNEYIHFDVKKSNIFKIIKLIMRLRTENFDLSFTATDTDLTKGPILTYLAGVPHRVGEVKNLGTTVSRHCRYNYPVQLNYSQHRVQSNLDLFRKISSKEVVSKTFFAIEEIHERKKKEFLCNVFKTDVQQYIIIHPGCKVLESFRRWPIDNYLFVAREITIKYKIPVIFVGGEDESDISLLVDKIANEHIVNAINKLDIGVTAALIRGTRLMIGNDSGLMHIAGAVGTPTVSLFSTEKPIRCAPWGTYNEIVEVAGSAKENGISGITVSQVIECVELSMLKIVMERSRI